LAFFKCGQPLQIIRLSRLLCLLSFELQISKWLLYSLLSWERVFEEKCISKLKVISSIESKKLGAIINSKVNMCRVTKMTLYKWTCFVSLNQNWTTFVPRATCGPQRTLMLPANIFLLIKQ